MRAGPRRVATLELRVYRAVMTLTGLATGAFYRRRRLGARAPATGPLLVVANHTNRLVDVVLALHAIERRALLLAKAPLFRRPALAWFVRGLGAVPVHRANERARAGTRDERARAETARSLAQAARTLAGGGAVLVFPEGVSHAGPGVLPAKTGAARIAFDALRENRALTILPVGLLYRDKGRFRSDAVTLIGDAIPHADLLPRWQIDERSAVEALTERIEEALRAVTLHLEDRAELSFVAAAHVVEDEAELPALAAGIARARAEAPATLDAVRERVGDRVTRLERLGLRVGEEPRAARAAGRAFVRALGAPFLLLRGQARRAGRRLRDLLRVARFVVTGTLRRHARREQDALRDDVERVARAGRLPPAGG
jgi:glycerol-3-phosphate O-acyltransferase / dihydroxyacetone phosphate acyltransferase